MMAVFYLILLTVFLLIFLFLVLCSNADVFFYQIHAILTDNSILILSIFFFFFIFSFLASFGLILLY